VLRIGTLTLVGPQFRWEHRIRFKHYNKHMLNMQVKTKKILDNFFRRVWFILEVLDSQWWVASQVGDFENSKVNITTFFESPKAGYVGGINGFGVRASPVIVNRK